MWFVEILLRAHGDDPRRVDGFVAAIIVIADMREIHRFRNPRHLVDIAQETVQVEIVADTALIAFKVGDIHRVETNQRCPQADIRFR